MRCDVRTRQALGKLGTLEHLREFGEEVGLPVAISPPDSRGQKWIESVYRDPAGGPLFGFYHLEPFGVGGTCEGWPPPQS